MVCKQHKSCTSRAVDSHRSSNFYCVHPIHMQTNIIHTLATKTKKFLSLHHMH